MNLLLFPIFVPVIGLFLCLLYKKWAKEIALAASLLVFLSSIFIIAGGEAGYSFAISDIEMFFSLRAYELSSYLLMAVSFFTSLIIIYSFKFMQKAENLGIYYANILLTLGAASGALLSSDLVLFLVFWGITGITLYMLVNMGGPGSEAAAKKTFLIVGGTDALMIMGIGIIWLMARTFDMSAIKLPIDSALAALAYLFVASAAFAKAGAIPFHTWIPDASEVAPIPVMAYLPAALDKILGIYLLARLSLDLFVIIPGSAVSIFLLALGSATIIIAVMMALVQHNFKKLLAYHSVSQVGYMLVGIGTALPIGIAGALLHMINNAVYKSCLFLSSGAIEKEVKTTELDRLGGLAKAMPVTFAVTLIAALSISGIPPLNGFFSKWMIYQSIVSLSKSSGHMWIVWLAAAMFGSALTLASFMKIIHAAFLADKKEISTEPKETSPWLYSPMIALAAICVIFGVFAFQLPLKFFISPSVPFVFLSGVWHPVAGLLLLMLGILIGWGIYLLGKLKLARRDSICIGGDTIPEENLRISGVSFYQTIKDIPVLKEMYEEAEHKFYDPYEQTVKLSLKISEFFKRLHSGLLHTYLAWCLLGLIALLVVFFR